jgi:hypothetical protein
MVVPKNKTFIAVNEPQYRRGSEPAEQSIPRSPKRETFSAPCKKLAACHIWATFFFLIS